jgi:hypothetical protein
LSALLQNLLLISHQRKMINYKNYLFAIALKCR